MRDMKEKLRGRPACAPGAERKESLKGDAVTLRPARTGDIKEVQKLINEFAKRQEMIPRSLNELYENLRDALVVEEDGEITATCSLHVVSEDMAEIRSLAVREGHQKKGIGKALLERAVQEAGDLGVRRIFSLTYQPEFFTRFGFRVVDKAALPHKVWGDCLKCHKFPECDETAVVLELGSQGAR
jgi:amino-acid N-acetyltransferase